MIHRLYTPGGIVSLLGGLSVSRADDQPQPEQRVPRVRLDRQLPAGDLRRATETRWLTVRKPRSPEPRVARMAGWQNTLAAVPLQQIPVRKTKHIALVAHDNKKVGPTCCC